MEAGQAKKEIAYETLGKRTFYSINYVGYNLRNYTGDVYFILKTKNMRKFKIEFFGRRNMKKGDWMFAIIPTIVPMNETDDLRSEPSVSIVWMFFELNFSLCIYNRKTQNNE